VIVGKRASTMFLGPETQEKGVVAGVRSFVEGLRDREWYNIEGELNSLSLHTQRQVLELVALIGISILELANADKYPTRTFAVSGSSAEIAYPAFRVFMKEIVAKRIGVLIPTEVAARLHIINGIPGVDQLMVDMPVADDLKRARFGDALKDISTEKAQIIRLLIILLAEFAH
jgi:hypothetical protein